MSLTEEVAVLMKLHKQKKNNRITQASAKKVEYTGPAKKKRDGLSTTFSAVGKDTGVSLVEKEQSHLSKSQSCNVGENQD